MLLSGYQTSLDCGLSTPTILGRQPFDYLFPTTYRLSELQVILVEKCLDGRLSRLVLQVATGTQFDLHELFSLVSLSTQRVEIGNSGFSHEAVFEVMFTNFSKRGFSGFKVTFGVEELAL